MAHPSLNVLVLSDFTGQDANVVRDYLYGFNQHSRHRFFYMHSWSKNQFSRLKNFDFDRFDAIFLFWDYYWIGSDDPLSYCHVPRWVSERIAESRALKVQFLQDEYRDVRLANRVMSRFGVNLMFSCVAPKDQELFYPKALIPSLIATYPVLTGYVPSYLEGVDYPAAIDRPIDIGYRSRKLAYYLGSLGQEKGTIADRFQEIADRFGFSANISVHEKDRIYGNDWLEFMKACRFSIGTESGASVVDFDGTIRKKCLTYQLEHPCASFEETRSATFPDVDGKVVVQTISPRLFEAAAFENTLVLHEGHYEGMIEPDVHYISVKKDYSNIEDVVERMRDRAFCERLAGAAKERLISSKQYSYQSFVRSVDAILERHAPISQTSSNLSRTLFYVGNYLNNDRLIPRGGEAVSVPHACDVMYHVNRYAPYVFVLLSSIWLISNFVCQAPTVVVKLVQKVLAAARAQHVSLGGLLKDWRVVALFFEMRGGIRARHRSGFEVHLSYDGERRQLTGRSVPPTAQDSGDWRESLHLTPDQTVGEVLKGKELAFSIRWDHGLVGNELPVRSIGSDSRCICLEADCVYHFEHLNLMRWQLDDEEAAFLTGLLFGGWKDPTWLQRIYAASYVCGALGYCVAVEMPLKLVRQVRSWLGGKAVQREPAQATR